MKSHAILPFVIASSIAAFVHSVWTLGVMFSGYPPDGFTVYALLWYIPPVMVAVAIDIGLIATAHEIARGERNRAKLTAFTLLALASYYLQWVYIVHHAPAIALAEGVQLGRGAAQWLNDLGIWILPAFLPGSALLYTFSQKAPGTAKKPHTQVTERVSETPSSIRANGHVPTISGNGKRNRGMSLLAQGEEVAEVAKALDVAYSTAYRWKQKMEKENVYATG